jgi:hypothetical protein
MYKLGLERCEKAGTQHLFTIETLNNLGKLYLHSDRLEEAYETHRIALDKFKTSL